MKGVLLQQLVRKKSATHEELMDSGLHRCLSATDLTVLGIGAIIGAGIFVLTGVQLPFFPVWLKAKGLDAGMIGIVQATETVKLILGTGEPLVGRLVRAQGGLEVDGEVDGGAPGASRGSGGGLDNAAVDLADPPDGRRVARRAPRHVCAECALRYHPVRHAARPGPCRHRSSWCPARCRRQ